MWGQGWTVREERRVPRLLHPVPTLGQCVDTWQHGGLLGAGVGTGNYYLVGTVTVWDDEKVLETDSGDGCIHC